MATTIAAVHEPSMTINETKRLIAEALRSGCMRITELHSELLQLGADKSEIKDILSKLEMQVKCHQR